jgi:hypothetical protein
MSAPIQDLASQSAKCSSTSRWTLASKVAFRFCLIYFGPLLSDGSDPARFPSHS